MPIRGRSAIVLGASMSGLLAARVLADRFDHVTVIERDNLPASPEGRKGVPQGAHVHGFWARGMNIVDRLLPGTRDALVAAGASHGDAARDLIWYQFDAQKTRESAGIPATLVSRPFLESYVRERVLAHPAISVIPGTSVRGLLTNADRSRVTGVQLQRAGGVEEPMQADYIVDATGRTGHATRWLEALGYGRPPESEVRIDVIYSSRIYERSIPRDANGSIIVTTPPAGRRGGVAFAVEGNRWVVTLIGFMGEEPPTDDAGFRDYARSLPHPFVHEIVSSERALTGSAVFKFPSNLRRHYERMKHFPEGFLVLGDAMTSFNPAYGQGMTVAALEAELLGACCEGSATTDGLARTFFRKAKPIVDVPWMITTGEDLRFPDATGKRPPLLDTLNGYLTRVHHAASIDPEVCRGFMRVASFEAVPPSLFAPMTFWRVMRGEQRYRNAGGMGGGNPATPVAARSASTPG